MHKFHHINTFAFAELGIFLLGRKDIKIFYLSTLFYLGCATFLLSAPWPMDRPCIIGNDS